MAAVGRAELDEGGVLADAPVIAGTQTELNRRRIGARGADRAERVGDRRAIAAEAVAGIRNRLAEARASPIVVEQNRGIRLPALVPGCRSLQRQPIHDPGHQRALHTLDEELLPVGVEENVADHTGVEEGDLEVAPVLPYHAPVPFQRW